MAEYDISDPDSNEPSAAAGGSPGPYPHEEVVPVDDAHDVGIAGHDFSAEDQALLGAAERGLVAELREDLLRAQAELVNFRARVERDRQANREAVIAEVLRAVLPAFDDLDRAEVHGDVPEGSPMALVVLKLRSAFERYGLKQVGVSGEPFDPAIHQAIVQFPTPNVQVDTVYEVIEPGYFIGDRLVRPAKVAVSVPSQG